MERDQADMGMDRTPRTLLERLGDLVASVNPDLYLAGAIVAVALPWLEALV